MSTSRLLRRLVEFLPLALPFYVVRFSVFGLPTTLLEIYLLILFAVFLWERRWPGVRDGWRRLGKWRGPVVAWALATLIAVFVSPSLRTGFGLWRAYVLEPLLVFLVLADTVRDQKDADPLRRSLFWTVIALSAWAAFQFVTGRGIPSPWDVSIAAGRRATGPFPFPNALALFVTPIGAWAFARWVSRVIPAKAGIQAKSINWIPTFVGMTIRSLDFWSWLTALISILLARSDGGLVAFLVVVLIVLLSHRQTRRWTAGVAIAAVVAVIAIRPLGLRVWNTLTFHEWSGQVRLTIWKESLAMLKDHPFFGAGFGGYPTVIKPYHHAAYLEIFQYPHNILLNLWSETGVLGVIAFGWIVVTWIRQSVISDRWTGIRTDHRSRIIDHLSALAPLLAILIHGLVDVPYFKNDLAVLFWMLAFLTTPFSRVVEED